MDVADGRASQTVAAPATSDIQWLDAFLGSSPTSPLLEELDGSWLDGLADRATLDELTGTAGMDARSAAAIDVSYGSIEVARRKKSHGDDLDRGTKRNGIQTVDDEMMELLGMREKISSLLETSESYIESVKSTIPLIREAQDETRRLEEYMKQVDEIYACDLRGAMLPAHAQSIKLPLFPEIYHDIPLIAYQAKEIEDLQVLSCNFVWTTKDAVRLKEIVLGQCKKAVALRRVDSTNKGVFAIVNAMDEVELAQASLPDPHTGEDPIDWSFVASELGTGPTPDDCRTHWLMVQRPGLCNSEWSESELSRLRRLVAKHANDGTVRDWSLLAKELDSGRLAVDCFSACQQHGMLEVFAKTMPDAWSDQSFGRREGQEMKRLCEVWDHRIAIITERLGTMRPKSHVAACMANHQPSQETSSIGWNKQADEGLIRFLLKSARCQRQTLFRNPQLVDKVGWNARFAHRPPNMSAKEVEARWQTILADYVQRPDKYVTPRKRRSSASGSAIARGPHELGTDEQSSCNVNTANGMTVKIDDLPSGRARKRTSRKQS